MKALPKDWKHRNCVIGRGGQMVTVLRETFGDTPIIGAEIGALSGTLSAFLLDHLPNLTLYMVDMWDGGYERYNQSEQWAKTHLANDAGDVAGAMNLAKALAATANHAHRRRIVQLQSGQAAAAFPPAFFDFIFIDADHTYEGCRADIDSWEPLVRPGGIVAGHDYANGIEPCWGVKRAVDETYGERVNLGANFTWWVHK